MSPPLDQASIGRLHGRGNRRIQIAGGRDMGQDMKPIPPAVIAAVHPAKQALRTPRARNKSMADPGYRVQMSGDS